MYKCPQLWQAQVLHNLIIGVDWNGGVIQTLNWSNPLKDMILDVVVVGTQHPPRREPPIGMIDVGSAILLAVSNER